MDKVTPFVNAIYELRRTPIPTEEYVNFIRAILHDVIKFNQEALQYDSTDETVTYLDSGYLFKIYTAKRDLRVEPKEFEFLQSRYDNFLLQIETMERKFLNRYGVQIKHDKYYNYLVGDLFYINETTNANIPNLVDTNRVKLSINPVTDNLNIAIDMSKPYFIPDYEVAVTLERLTN